MRWLVRGVLVLLGLVILVPLLATATICVGLNTGGGRAFAVREINHVLAGQAHVTGLAGHFPADLKLGQISLADSQGVWLAGTNLELRWQPADLFSRTLHITGLSAETIALARLPAPATQQKSTPNAGFKPPNLHLALDRFAVGRLAIARSIAPGIAGQPITLALTGSAHLRSPSTGSLALRAIAANGQGTYQLQAAIDPSLVDTSLTIAEPPDGLLGHFAGPGVHAPFTLALTLRGPRNDAALDFAAALGAAKLNGTGTLGLDPDAPKADIVLAVPALAPIAALAGQAPIAGATSLHVIAGQMPDHATNISVDGNLALTQAPGPAAKLIGPAGHLSLLLSLASQTIDIRQLTIKAAGFSATAAGSITQTGAAPANIDLNTHLDLTDIAAISPTIKGAVTADGTVSGTAQNFAVSALISGNITEKSIPSGPFSVMVNANNLPTAPTGTLTASGALENSPLILDTAFARDAAGNTDVKINNTLWRSLRATADLHLAAGATLPTGHAKFTVTRLADFRAFAPTPLAGSVTGDFAHQDGGVFALNLIASQLQAVPGIGPVNATLHAAGPTNALAVRLQASVARLFAVPARVTAAAVLDLDHRAAQLSAFTASWHGLNAALLGPAGMETKPGLAIQHLALSLNGGGVTLDGALTPRLNATFTARNLPAGIASLFAPGIAASGMISAKAAITGTPQNPAGTITLNAAALRAHTGPAAALPPADLNLSATLANHDARLTARLDAGNDLALNASGMVPLDRTGAIALHLTGRTDLRLADPILSAQGTTIRGLMSPDSTVSGTPAAPHVSGSVALAGGSVENIASGLNLTQMSAVLAGQGDTITLQNLTATAGHGSITGHGSVDLATPGIPVDFTLNAAHATPVSSDIVTETFDAALTLKGFLRGALALAGSIDLTNATINIPKSLPPSVANLPIRNRGDAPPPPPAAPPDVALNLLINARDQIFVRGDGLFAELGGRLHITGTAANPDPEGGFTLIRGDFSLAGRNLQFTQGTVGFNGDGFMPSLDLEAAATSNNVTSTLIVGGTAAQPTITLTSTPPAPSDEILANLLFGTGTQDLTAFQAASLAAALAQLSGVGGGGNPLDSVRNALGLDELSLGGSGSGAPSIQAGRYVAPGVYVGAQQATNGQGTQATVQVNLYKGLKLQTATGTSGNGGGTASSVGITYQFNY